MKTKLAAVAVAIVAAVTPSFLQPIVAITSAQPNTEVSQDNPVSRKSMLDAVLAEIVQKQASDWNRGDIPAFMTAYWNSENLTFSSGGKTTRGWTATRDRYLSRYPDRATMGRLTFSDLEVQQLDTSAALMLGRWRLDHDEPIAGNFSLVWRKIEDHWLIVHDHTSSDPPQASLP